jgi:hypothetical protein
MPFTLKLEGIMFLDEQTTGGTLKRATIQIERDYLIIDGMKINFDIIPQFMYEFAHPDPRKWYRLERKDEACLVHMEIREVEEAVPRRCSRCGYETTQPFNFCPRDGIAMQPAPELQAIRAMTPEERRAWDSKREKPQ